MRTLLGLEAPRQRGIFALYISLWIIYGLLNERAKQQHIRFDYTAAVLLQSLLKLTIACYLFMTQDLEPTDLLPSSHKSIQEAKLYPPINAPFWRHLKLGIRALQAQTVKHYSLLYYYMIPAGLYACYDVLAYVNLRKFDASTYFLLLQFRLVVTGMLHQCMFHKKLRGIQWIALLIISFGCCIKTASEFWSVSNETFTPKIAYALLMLQILCSTFAGVYNEVLLKRTQATLNVQNIFMYVDSTLCTLLLIGMGVVERSEVNSSVFSVKAIASALELVILPLLSAFFFDLALTVSLGLAVISVAFGVYLYSKPIESHDTQEVTSIAS
uniref:Drug/Metabolite Transporter (DMT) Superfamily putat n=1 Tax=Albugo laibachii Nc14 TaxID=890382 RepID=F0X0K6_9STRA|nr:Drug/Metabolite Transporter (DMT) Superfamily putat [Albugo laibachii Nc14]|eukprot:CCA27297.1 Drug/Metabolite Transporter (DMT) Superfamily putat [Albugo laibachii Nc14]